VGAVEEGEGRVLYCNAMWREVYCNAMSRGVYCNPIWRGAGASVADELRGLRMAYWGCRCG
jgi:hypothetical protein